MNLKIILTLIIVSSISFSFILGYLIAENLNKPYNLEQPIEFNNKEKYSPSDWIKENMIQVLNDKVIININNPKWAKFTDTNSMDPLFDETSNAIEIIPKSEDDIKIGDIISYKSNLVEGTIIHRVTKKERDEKGTYFILKGDNNKNADPEKIRFEQIERVLVAIIY